jgi:dehydrogenase/reductase SDR family member 7B
MGASRLREKIIWLTGASSGIGEALAYHLSDLDATLILTARREDALEKVRQGCANGERHFVLPIDILATDTHAPAYEAIIEKFGKLDVLINCAGVGQRSTALQTAVHVDRRIMDLNYFGPLALTKLVLPGMLARRDGQIVVVSSLAAKLALPGRSAYAASKHALHGFFNALRAELGDQGVSVTLACPGYVRTNTSHNALVGDGNPYNQLDRDIARGMTPEMCAAQIVRAIENRRAEVYIARYEKLGLYLNQFFPQLFRLIARSIGKRRPC